LLKIIVFLTPIEIRTEFYIIKLSGVALDNKRKERFLNFNR
jgi:hypothetical protein